MIETVVALLMFVNGEIKEHLVQKNGWLMPSRQASCGETVLVNLYPTNAIRVKQK